MTDEQVIEARRMRDGGTAFRLIAKSFGVSRGAVQAYLDPELRERRRLHSAGYNAGYYQRTATIRKQWQNDYRRDNPSKVKDSRQTYYKANRGAITKRNKEWRGQNLPYILAANTAREALILGVTVGNLIEIVEVYRQAREDEPIRCYLCGELIESGDRHVDHKKPLSKGGKHCVSNLGITHSFCNLSKHNKMPEERGLLL